MRKLTPEDEGIILREIAACGGKRQSAWKNLKRQGKDYTYWNVRMVGQKQATSPKNKVPPPPPTEPVLRAELLRAMYRKRGTTLRHLAERLQVSEDQVDDMIDHLEDSGYMIGREGNRVLIAKQPKYSPEKWTDQSPLDGNWRRFGLLGDSHVCSTYQRLDVLEEAYSYWDDLGIKTVYHTGNIVDGHTRFNRYELHCHGATDQAAYLLENYPRRKGITTHFITGRCHEGWWFKDIGLDFGRYVMGEMFAYHDRRDLNYLGFQERDIELVNRKGKRDIMRLFHPGGGTSYAYSYAIQKIVQSIQGGEKPGMIFVGHFHKAEYLPSVRNVHCIQTGCGQDQTRWMRSKKIDAHVGYWTVSVQQDKNGAIRRVLPEWTGFYDRKYHIGLTVGTEK